MAVSGQSFCSSAWDAFLLNLKHMAKFSFAKFLASMFIFIGQAAIALSTVGTCVFVMKNVTHTWGEVSTVVGPLVVTFLAGLLTASVFLGLLDTVVNSLLYCLAIDMDCNGGTPAKGPKTFHDSMHKVTADQGENNKVAADYEAPANNLN